MNETLKTIHSQRSTHGDFLPDGVSIADQETILAAQSDPYRAEVWGSPVWCQRSNPLGRAWGGKSERAALAGARAAHPVFA